MGNKWKTSVNPSGPTHPECEISVGDKWEISVNSCGPRHHLPLCVKISDICGEMNPFGFSALEEVNLLFTLMVSSTVMVDIVFARLIYCTFYWR